MSLEIWVWIYSFRALKTCLGGGLSDRDTIRWEEASLTASPCQPVNYLNESASACTYIMVAHVANCCDCGVIKQLIMMQLTISRIMKYKGGSIMIWKGILNYITAYVRERCVVSRNLFTPLCPARLFVSCWGFIQGQAESGLVLQNKELT